MRNVFDQYVQPENRLTHALMSTLANDRRLIRPFIHWLGFRNVPPAKAIRIGEQQAPGLEAESDKEESEGLPDGCFFDSEGWALLVESKIQAGLSVSQLKRHRRAAARYGYASPHILVLAVDDYGSRLKQGATFKPWREVFN
ncbi:MAG: hypothetical protein ACE15C_07890 [Phycisphaerae bacterium]